MPYKRRELFLIKGFNFNISEPDRKATEPQDKFLVVLDVVNDDRGIFCLTTSLSGKTSRLIPPMLTGKCTYLDKVGHFFKFEDLKVCDEFTFEKDTFIRGIGSDVFETSIAILYQAFNTKESAVKKGEMSSDLFLSIISCLCQSHFLERELISKLHKIGEDEAKKIAKR